MLTGTAHHRGRVAGCWGGGLLLETDESEGLKVEGDQENLQ